MNHAHQILAIFQSLGWPEMVVIGVLALLIFGRRLPEVGRSLGKSFVEFKRGLKETGDELDDIKSDAEKAASDAGHKAADQVNTLDERRDTKADAAADRRDA